MRRTKLERDLELSKLEEWKKTQPEWLQELWAYKPKKDDLQ